MVYTKKTVLQEQTSSYSEAVSTEICRGDEAVADVINGKVRMEREKDLDAEHCETSGAESSLPQHPTSSSTADQLAKSLVPVATLLDKYWKNRSPHFRKEQQPQSAALKKESEK
jgi:hypothetical protein